MERHAKRPIDQSLEAWLKATGSLTARLRLLENTHVKVIRQESLLLLPHEQVDLHCISGHVREVMIFVNYVPAVWARSATPSNALHGAWKALAELGIRPLAEFCFRSPVSAEHLCTLSTYSPTVYWNAESIPFGPTSMVLGPMQHYRDGGRSSAFFIEEQTLRVFEAFAPWIGTLPQRNYL